MAKGFETLGKECILWKDLVSTFNSGRSCSSAMLLTVVAGRHIAITLFLN